MCFPVWWVCWKIRESVSKWGFNCSFGSADLCKETALISHQPFLPLHLKESCFNIHPSTLDTDAHLCALRTYCHLLDNLENCPCNVLPQIHRQAQSCGVPHPWDNWSDSWQNYSNVTFLAKSFSRPFLIEISSLKCMSASQRDDISKYFHVHEPP